MTDEAGVASASEPPARERASFIGEANREQGAYLILYALLAVVFFTLAALVLDVAALRQGRRSDRATTDLAATAAVTELDVADPSTFAGACSDAWGYVLANRTESTGAASPPDCTGTFPATACDPTIPRTATGTLGPLTIEITQPVPDSSPLMMAEVQGADIPQAVTASNDGTACERVAVRIVRTRRFLFAGIAGTDGATTDVHSVARALTTTSTTRVPAVVAVDPTACGTLVTDPGAGSLQLGSATQAGLALVDTDASGCSAGSYAISAGGSGDPVDRILAVSAGSVPGEIRSFALAGTRFASAFDPGAVGAGRLDPQPSPALVRTGRALIDSRYRCATCPGGRDVITPFVADRNGPGAPAGTTLTYSGPCTIPAGPAQEIATTSLYVDCPNLVVEGKVTFLGTSVTFAGDVTLVGNACLAVNDTSCGAAGVTSGDADVFVRGSLSKETKGEVALPRTFLYAGGTVTIGVDEDTTVGNSTVTWTAPQGGDFEDLLFWSESASTMTIGEQKNTVLEGTFFSPRADVVVNPRSTGSAGVSAPLQVVAGTVRLTGTGVFRLQPSADRATGAFVRQVRLIR